MSFRSVAEALEIVAGKHSELRAEVEGLSEEQQHFRPVADRWTIAEIVEHVAIVQEGMGKIASKLVREAEAAGALAKPDGTIGLVATDFIPDRESRRLNAPENVRPHGDASIGDSLGKLEKDYQRLQDMRPRIETVDLGAVTFPHPAFGALTGYQWLALLGAHEGRHIQQIKEIKASDGYPA
jgi:hypothetical protein